MQLFKNKAQNKEFLKKKKTTTIILTIKVHLVYFNR